MKTNFLPVGIHPLWPLRLLYLETSQAFRELPEDKIPSSHERSDFGPDFGYIWTLPL